MKIKIIKSHGSSNDFILIDIRKNENLFSDSVKSKMSINLCNRESSIGADGILFIENSKSADCTMRIFNSDGSEAEMCGNGIRIVGRYMCEHKKTNSVYVKNITGLSYLIERKPDFFKNVIAYKATFPTVSFKTCNIPINFDKEYLINEIIPDISENISFTGIAMPNPHLITYQSINDKNEIIRLGELINSKKSIFSKGANLSFVTIIDGNTIYVSTFERGVGMTNSCGTAMCASVISSIKNKFLNFNKQIKVLNEGGFVFVKVKNDYTCELTGNATYVFDATIDFDINKLNDLKFFKGETFKDEIKNYSELIDNNNIELEKLSIK